MNLRNVVVQDTHSAHHGQEVDIRIEKGIIKSIVESKKKTTAPKIVTPGFMDLSSHFNDPGTEYKEDLITGLKTACEGGFTDVCILPNTLPVADNRSTIEYILTKASRQVTSAHPLGALSKKLEGDSLAEILDLRESGAVAFTDGIIPVMNAELLLKALQYVQKFKGLVISRPRDLSLSRGGQMHEGSVSTGLGLVGMSSLSEMVIIERDLSILAYTGGRLHIHGVSTSESVALIAKAKKTGLAVTCDVILHQLCYSDDSLSSFDPSYKVDPPLRTNKDVQALKKGLANGTIDALSIDHHPQDLESKNLEFDLAEFGMIGLQTAFSSLLSLTSKELSLVTLLEKLSNGPRHVLNFPPIKIEKGEFAKLTLLDAHLKWQYNQESNISKSNNSPLLGHLLTGKSVGVINGEKSYIPS
ncbi:MAG: dihydroorotase [Flammeovirgaceae bacterium]|nr:dihydroorotase [Flammeovirgaceae bacterium]